MNNSTVQPNHDPTGRAPVGFLLSAALAYAARGWAVHPCNGQKRPRTDHGVKDATTDAAQIKRWWARWPRATIGVACGPSGLVAIDCDVKNPPIDGIKNFEALGIDTTGALVATTPTGGMHFIFTDTTGGKIGNSGGKLAEGVDIRGNGGYIIAPPSISDAGAYTQMGDWSQEPAPLPGALAALLLQPKKTPRDPRPVAENHAASAGGSAYGKAGLENELQGLRSTSTNRNNALYAAACNLGELVGGGELPEFTVSGALHDAALSIGLDEPETIKTIRSGMEKGKCQPRSAPPRGQRPPVARAYEQPPEDTGATDNAALPDDLFWTSKYPPKTRDYVNVLTALGYRFRMNQLTDTTEVNGGPISDALVAKIRTQLRDLNYTRVNVAEDAYTARAYDCSYHPVREFLEGAPWDGRDTIGRLVSYFTWDRGNLQNFLKRWLIGAVARAYEPQGAQNRLLALDGPQGTGKSYFVRWLASALNRPAMFVEGPIDPDDKDNLIRLVSAWIWEVSELSNTTRKADRDALKYFLSMQQVTVRKPYGHYDLVKPALASFIGTVNDVGGFLDDATGSRRFMSVHLNSIDWGYTQLDPGQVWAQAKALYDAGDPWTLTPAESQEAETANSDYQVADPLGDLLGRLYELTGDVSDSVSTVDVRAGLNSTGWRLRSPRSEAMAISAVFRTWGLSPEKVSRGDKRERGYVGVRAL